MSLAAHHPVPHTSSGLLFESVLNEDIQMVPDLSQPVSTTDIMELEDRITGSINTSKNIKQDSAILPTDETSTWSSDFGYFNDHVVAMKEQPFIGGPDRNLSEDLNQFLEDGSTTTENEKVTPSSSAAAVSMSVPVSTVQSILDKKSNRSNSTQSRRNSNSGASHASKSKRKSSKTKTSAAIAKACKEPMAVRSRLPVVAFDESGLLPTDHRPARGRGRLLQLAAMSQEQIDAEEKARQEKNRLAARDCRLRRKNHVQALDTRVKELEKKDQESQKIIAKLKAKLAKFTA